MGRRGRNEGGEKQLGLVHGDRGDFSGGGGGRGGRGGGRGGTGGGASMGGGAGGGGRGGRGGRGRGAAPVFSRPIPKFLQKYSAQLKPLGRPLGGGEDEAEDGPTIVGNSGGGGGEGEGGSKMPGSGSVMGLSGKNGGMNKDEVDEDEAAHVADALKHAAIVDASAALPIGKRSGKSNAKVTFDEMMARSKGKSFSGVSASNSDSNAAATQNEQQLAKQAAENKLAIAVAALESDGNKRKRRSPSKVPKLDNSTLLSFDDEEEEEEEEEEEQSGARGRRKSRGNGRRRMR